LDLIGRQPERCFFHRANMMGKPPPDKPSLVTTRRIS
jgi:hypothetical protein